ncbi:MAG: hypothetical protein BGO41_13375 [Clostridiales bacterium 38-18]|nr:MAG: hypothetical protein BGO41_13375 [Clostridiales bacterium 38-18]
MYKVLIVDDEVLVRIGLKNTIDWEEIGFTVVGEASNGEQGYAQFLKLNPDVVITDIKMPKQDGLWLTDKIHKENKDTKILVLTCYDEFQFARTALKNGATDYMLKSEIVDDELIALMKRFKTTLDDSSAGQSVIPNKHHNQNAIKRSLLNDLIKVKFNFDEKLLFRFEEQNFQLSNTKYAFINLELKLKDQKNAKQISETTVNLIIDQLNEKGIQYLFNGYMDEHLFLISSADLTLSTISRMASAVQNGVVQYFDIAINLIYTNAFTEADALLSHYALLMEKSEMLFYVPSGESLIENTDHIRVLSGNTHELKLKTTAQFVDNIGQENLEGILHTIDEVLDLFRQKCYPPRIAKVFMTQLVGELYNVFQYLFDAPEVAFSYSAFHESVMKSKHVSELKNIVTDLFKTLINELSYIRDHQSRYIIKQAINFVEQNYDQNISLEDVAKELSLSKQYVCSVFKRETGQNLSTFINQVRIDKAKQFLVNPAYRNKDIYAMVGYSNQQYFTRVFKKMTGMTTSEWQKHDRKEN